MDVLGSTEDFSISSVRVTGSGSRVTERAPEAVNRSHSEADEVARTSICARIIEVLNGRQIRLDGDFRFEKLPKSNDQITILNQRQSYEIMRVLRSTIETETTIYVRWMARR